MCVCVKELTGRERERERKREREREGDGWTGDGRERETKNKNPANIVRNNQKTWLRFQQACHNWPKNSAE